MLSQKSIDSLSAILEIVILRVSSKPKIQMLGTFGILTATLSENTSDHKNDSCFFPRDKLTPKMR